MIMKSEKCNPNEKICSTCRTGALYVLREPDNFMCPRISFLKDGECRYYEKLEVSENDILRS